MDFAPTRPPTGVGDVESRVVAADRRRAFDAPIVRDIGDDHTRAGLREADCTGAPDPGRRSGHKHRPVAQIDHQVVEVVRG